MGGSVGAVMAVDGAGSLGVGVGVWVGVTLTVALGVVRAGAVSAAGDGWRVRMGTADTGLSDAGATTCRWWCGGRPFGGACDDAGTVSGCCGAGPAGNTSPITVTVSR